MEKTQNEIQKERRAELEQMANELIKRCQTATLTSINEKGYPRTCVLGIAKAEGFMDIFFITGKRSEKAGKVPEFEKNPKASVCYYNGCDSVTLIGEVTFVTDKETQNAIWDDAHRGFFKKGTDDPKFRLLKFHTMEATFWIQGKFRTCEYKQK